MNGCLGSSRFGMCSSTAVVGKSWMRDIYGKRREEERRNKTEKGWGIFIRWTRQRKKKKEKTDG